MQRQLSVSTQEVVKFRSERRLHSSFKEQRGRERLKNMRANNNNGYMYPKPEM